ncbi:MAG: hypothetical protein SFY67_18145 [Candidatus Melainabacteria bacterium]|nr:hypothetical protein [Candidatus Melainabacteria bacterium]
MPPRRGQSNQSNQGSIWFIRFFAFVWNSFLIIIIGSLFTKSGTSPHWGMILFMIPFVAVGVFMTVMSFRPKMLLGIPDNVSGVPTLEYEGKSGAKHELKPSSTPTKNLGLSLFFCLFWNGIVGAFVYVVIKDWMQGNHQWFLILFLIPFVLIGLLILYGVFHSFLSLFNPRTSLSLSSNMLKPGQDVTVRWSFQGNAERIENLKITLQGREEAVYTRGTSTYTDKNVFMTIPIFETKSKSTLKKGSASLKLPDGIMPSFEAQHNKIIWSIHVQGEIPKWPDVQDEYTISIFPLGQNEIRAIKDSEKFTGRLGFNKHEDSDVDEDDDDDSEGGYAGNSFKRR